MSFCYISFSFDAVYYKSILCYIYYNIISILLVYMIYKQKIKVFHGECSNKRLSLIMEVLQLIKDHILCPTGSV